MKTGLKHFSPHNHLLLAAGRLEKPESSSLLPLVTNKAMEPSDYKSERIKRGLSQAELAALVGVSRGCINYREAGHPRYPITVEAWLAICSLPQATKRKSRKGQNK